MCLALLCVWYVGGCTRQEIRIITCLDVGRYDCIGLVVVAVVNARGGQTDRTQWSQLNGFFAAVEHKELAQG